MLGGEAAPLRPRPVKHRLRSRPWPPTRGSPDGVGLTGLAAGAVPALVLGPQGGAAAGGKHRALPR